MPHGHCYLWKSGLVWTHVVSDALIGLAYASISLSLYALVRKIRVPFSTMVLAFGVFIGACGWTHLNEIWNLWHSDYWYSGAVKALTALASVATGIWLIRLKPQIIAFAEAARASQGHLKSLEESEKTLRSFFDSAPMMMGVVELLEDDILHLSDNAAASELFGRTPDAMRGKLASEMGVPSSVTRGWIAHYRSAETLGAPVRFEYWHETGGRRRFFSATVSLIGRTDAGRSRFSYVVQDATEMKRMTDALQSEQKRTAGDLRLKSEALENSLNGFDIVNDRGEFVYANRAYLKMWGYDSLEELLKTSPASHCADPGTPERIIRALKETGECNIEFVARRKDGSHFDVNMWARLTHDSEGNEIYPTTSIDITERKRALREVEESERRFRTYTEAMPQMAFVADIEGNLIYFNQRFYDYLGKDGGLGGWSWKDQDIHHPDDLERTVETWTESLRTGKPYQIEYRLRRFDGQYRWHLGRALPVRDSSGKIQQWLGTNTDIHDQKVASRALEEALRARDEFLSIASHELKTPLTSMKLRTQMGKRSIEKGDDRVFARENVIRLIEESDRQLSRLSRLVDDMLDVSRIATGHLTMEPEPLELCPFVEGVVDRLRPQFQEARVEVDLQACESLTVRWDHFRIDQVLTNLLTNALKYGAGKPVAVRVSASGDRVRIEVRDQGPGIAKENQERIFMRFERAISANVVSGLGLGLYITRQIVFRHGGTIRLDSEPGKGSTFVVELPAEPSFS
jgi:PAS domain S-box-containing protein